MTDFPVAVKQSASNIVDAAVEIYHQMSIDLLPTPAKSHYVFNLRDLSKCVQGTMFSTTKCTFKFILSRYNITELHFQCLTKNLYLSVIDHSSSILCGVFINNLTYNSPIFYQILNFLVHSIHQIGFCLFSNKIHPTFVL